jgi:hypothetical protein
MYVDYSTCGHGFVRLAYTYIIASPDPSCMESAVTLGPYPVLIGRGELVSRIRYIHLQYLHVLILTIAPRYAGCQESEFHT